MTEYTPDQINFVESFTNKRDTLTLEVGLLQHEKDGLLATNRDLAEINSALQKGIDEMNANASTIAFEQAEKVNNLKLEKTQLEEELKTLRIQKETLTQELNEKNNTLITLGVLIKSIQVATQDTTEQIRKMGNDLNVFTGRVESASVTIQGESERVKTLTSELSGVIDSERKTNYEKSRELDNREIAIIGREKLVELKYQEALKK